MDDNDFRALIELRDDMEDQEDKQLLRRTIRYIERMDRYVGKLRNLTRDRKNASRIDTDN